MAGRHEQRIDHNVFRTMYSAFVNRVVAESPGCCKERLFGIGVKIGERLADDFFLNTKPKGYMELQEVAENISKSFLPHYFSFHPDLDQDIVSMKGLLGTPYSGIGDEHLEMVRGILDRVYSYLSRAEITFEMMYDRGEPRLFVRGGLQRTKVIVKELAGDGGSDPQGHGSG